MIGFILLATLKTLLAGAGLFVILVFTMLFIDFLLKKKGEFDDKFRGN